MTIIEGRVRIRKSVGDSVAYIADCKGATRCAPTGYARTGDPLGRPDKIPPYLIISASQSLKLPSGLFDLGAQSLCKAPFCPLMSTR